MTAGTRAKQKKNLAVEKSSSRKPQEERWPEIISAATDLFWEKGYDAATLQDIANRVGILKGSIYYYIESKADLRAHLLAEAHKDGLKMIRAVAEGEPRPIHRFYNLIIRHVHYVHEHMARTAVFLHEIRRLSAAERQEIGVDDQAFARVFVACIKDAIEAGLMRPELDPALAGTCTLTGLNSPFTWYSDTIGVEVDDIALHLASTLTRGLATDAGIALLSKIKKA